MPPPKRQLAIQPSTHLAIHSHHLCSQVRGLHRWHLRWDARFQLIKHYRGGVFLGKGNFSNKLQVDSSLNVRDGKGDWDRGEAGRAGRARMTQPHPLSYYRAGFQLLFPFSVMVFINTYFLATPTAHRSSWARDWTWATLVVRATAVTPDPQF